MEGLGTRADTTCHLFVSIKKSSKRQPSVTDFVCCLVTDADGASFRIPLDWTARRVHGTWQDAQGRADDARGAAAVGSS
jgi:hypothetical protein